MLKRWSQTGLRSDGMSSSKSSGAAKGPPHIVIINPDQWRSDVMGHMGNPAAVTPNLDHCVRTDGVSFKNAFCQNPVCTPSRCSFMTGWYPHVRGHRTMTHMLRPDEPMLLKTLKDSGYFVWWGGKNDVVPAQNGFEAYCSRKHVPLRPLAIGNSNRWKATPGDTPGSDTYYSFYKGHQKIPSNETCCYDNDWDIVYGAIEQIKNAPVGQPLCIYLPLEFPHPPYGVEDPWYSMIDTAKVPPRIPTPESWEGLPSILKGIHDRQHMQGWSEERWQELRRTYYGMCSRVDHQFGLVVNALRQVGMYDDTAIFFFSDHGDFTGDYGLVEKTQNTFQDCLTHVPFIIKPPAKTPLQPRISSALVELIDFSATVEALTGIQPKHTHFGRSLLPVLAGTSDTHRDAVFCEGGRLHGETHCMELGLGPESQYWPRISLECGEGPEHMKSVMCRTHEYKYVRRHSDSDELYDLRNDPGECQNRINDPKLASVLAQLKERLLTFYMETGDVVPHELDKRW